MTLKIIIINDSSNPTDRAVEVERLGIYTPTKTVLKSGERMEGYVFEGSEFHVKETDPPSL